MFSLDAQISSAAEQDRFLRQRAVEEGATLFRREAADAIAIVRGELRAAESLAERRYLRLVVVELERLARQARQTPVWHCPSLRTQLWDRLRRLMG